MSSYKPAKRSAESLTIEVFDPHAITYSAPRATRTQGAATNVGQTVYVNSTQTRSNILLLTPLIRTWGVSAFAADDGAGPEKYTLSLSFPTAEYATPETDMFLAKMLQFQEKVKQDAYTYRGAWFGDEELSKDVINSKFCPIVKYPMIKDAKGNRTKKPDLTKSPTFAAKVPYYDGKWNVDIYDMDKVKLFPNEDPNLTPVDFVPKSSFVIAKIACASIWLKDMMWGVKWNVTVIFVKPNEQLDLHSIDDVQLPGHADIAKRAAIEAAAPLADEDEEHDEAPPAKAVAPTTFAVDSDEEGEPAPAPAPAPAPVAVEAPAPKKKLTVKKTVAAK